MHYTEACNSRKHIVLRDLFTEFGVKVDQVRACSSGTSTTGNVCRRIFSNPKLASEALGVDEDLIRRFRNILLAINSERPLNAETMSLYCKDTYYKFIHLYNWYYIPATVHKILAHPGALILNTPVPLGSIREECREARHNIFRKDREYHPRKCTRE